MTSASVANSPSQDDLNEFFDDLLIHLDEKQVVPIVGPELLTVTVDGAEMPLYRYVADRLAARLNVSTEGLPASYSLNDVVVRLGEKNKSQLNQVYAKVCAIMKERRFQPSPALRQLARIRNFRLFVTTTFDNLLQQAIDQERFNGEPNTAVYRFSPTAEDKDLEPEWKARSGPAVFHLFGQVSGRGDYVVTDADTLEFLYWMGSESRRPTRLLDELNENHLLIIGCPFPDWLARFFIRTTKNGDLSANRSETQVLADSQSSHDQSLTLFLNTFSQGTTVFPGTAAEFIDALVERWERNHPPTEGPANLPLPAADATERDAVFLSYAREDKQAAERLCDGMSDVTNVWFDSRALRSGDQYDLMIQRRIKNCTLFVPIISRATVERDEGYFHREWDWARKRLAGLSDTRPFIVPVIVDDTRAEHEAVPAEFWKFQIAHLPGGQVTPSFLADLRDKIRAVRAPKGPA